MNVTTKIERIIAKTMRQLEAEIRVVVVQALTIGGSAAVEQATSGPELEITSADLPRWTPQRNALLNENLHTTDRAQLLERLNRLPGSRILYQQMTSVLNWRKRHPPEPTTPAAHRPRPEVPADPVDETVPADIETIGGWAVQQKLCAPGEPVSLKLVNQHRRDLGLPAFQRTDVAPPASRSWPHAAQVAR